MLQGKRTYIFSGLVVLFSVLFAFGVIDQETFITLIGIFGGASMYTMRLALNK